MNKQMIIALGGEYGAGAHIIAENLAKKYSLPVYDARILQYIADEKNIDVDTGDYRRFVFDLFYYGFGSGRCDLAAGSR